MTYAHDVGAWPRYAPQMAESILVQRVYPMTLSRTHRQQGHGLEALFAPGSHMVCYKMLWTDTNGHHHGRAWIWSLDNIVIVDRRKQSHYPMAIASTEAGCMWVYRDNGRDTAELQTAGPHGIPLNIEELDPSKPDEQKRAIKGLFENGMVWNRCTGDEAAGYQVWFGDDLDTHDPIPALGNLWDHDIRTTGRDV